MYPTSFKSRLFIALALLIILVSSCSTYQSGFRQVYSDYKTFKSATDSIETNPFLKAHLKNGDVAIFIDKWKINDEDGTINGSGVYYDNLRKPLDSNGLQVDINEIAIFETNTELLDQNSGRISGLTVLGVADVVITGLCIMFPKACFGSCPTIYLSDTLDVHAADAEGFSSSIIPSMKARDIDALKNGPIESDKLVLILKNEALETHVIDKVNLLLVPREEGDLIFHSTEDNFYKAKSAVDFDDIKGAISKDLFAKEDGDEWFSKADPNDLNEKEEIIFKFNNQNIDGDNNIGLLLSFRQSLMTTYLFYNMMDYLGDMRIDFIAAMEQGTVSTDMIYKMYELLGGIEVFVRSEGKEGWNYAGVYNESGPIAINRQLLKMDVNPQGESMEIKLRMTKGLWRIDNARLALGLEEIIPINIKPSWVKNEEGLDYKAFEDITTDNRNLVTQSGDKYQIGFDLPEKRDYELFLMSEGYYIEWLREEWLKSKNLSKLSLFINKPEKYLKREAKSYKVYEEYMEEMFWNSRIK